MITLKTTKKQINRYNANLDSFISDEKDPNIILMLEISKVHELSDMFCPYQMWISSLTDEDRAELNIVDDVPRIDFNGFYITKDTNDHYGISRLTKYIVEDHLDYGVVDNASQILSNVADIPENSVVLMTPIIADHSPEAAHTGWRWHKWGKYYGIQNPMCEYINDEKNINMVYVFDVITLKTKEDVLSEKE